MSVTSLLSLENIAFERDDIPLFSHVNLSIQPGQVWQLEGANGAGKTTLLRIMAGLVSASEGRLLWKGDISNSGESYRHELLFLGHATGLKQALSPLENLQWWSSLHSVHDELDFWSLLADIGLYGYEETPCYQLSAGQQRRAALVRMLASSATLWLLDEPFTAIDKQGVVDLQHLLRGHAERGGAVVLTSHQDLALPNLHRFAFPSVVSPQVMAS